MADARFPERWIIDRRVAGLSDGAFRLMVLALAWSVSNRTDGVLQQADLALILRADPGKAGELAKVGLWQRDRDRWLITDYTATQTSSHDLDVLDNVRRAEREKKQRQRLKDREDRAAKCGWSTGTVPWDHPQGPSPGTAEARQGEARQGEARQVLGINGDRMQATNWPPIARCETCGSPLHRDLVTEGQTVHPSCPDPAKPAGAES